MARSSPIRGWPTGARPVSHRWTGVLLVVGGVWLALIAVLVIASIGSHEQLVRHLVPSDSVGQVTLISGYRWQSVLLGVGLTVLGWCGMGLMMRRERQWSQDLDVMARIPRPTTVPGGTYSARSAPPRGIQPERSEAVSRVTTLVAILSVDIDRLSAAASGVRCAAQAARHQAHSIAARADALSFSLHENAHLFALWEDEGRQGPVSAPETACGADGTSPVVVDVSRGEIAQAQVCSARRLVTEMGWWSRQIDDACYSADTVSTVLAHMGGVVADLRREAAAVHQVGPSPAFSVQGEAVGQGRQP